MSPLFGQAISSITSSATTTAPGFGAGVINFSFLLSAMVWAPVIVGLAVLALPGGRGTYGRTDLPEVARNTALVTMAALLVLCLLGYIQFQSFSTGLMFEEHLAWLPAIGAGYHLGVTGVDMTVLLLGSVVGLVAVVASAPTRERPRAYYALLLWAQAAFNGFVAAQDLLLMLLFWAAAAVPLALLVAGWTGGRSRGSARFFAYSAFGTVAFGVAVLVAYLAGGGTSFDAGAVAAAPGTRPEQVLVAMGLLVAAATRLPLVPLHGWVHEAFADAPAGVAVFIAGASSRLGAYLLLKVLVADFHSGARLVAPYLAALAALTVVYGALNALRSDDLRRTAAYAALVPGGLAVLGVATLSPLGEDGATLAIFTGGLAAALMVGVAATVAYRAQGRSWREVGGIAPRAPRLAWSLILACFAVLGVPGLGTFNAGFMTGLASVRPDPVAAAVVGLALALTGVAVARLLCETLFRAPLPDSPGVTDTSLSETWYVGILVAALLWVGLLPSGPQLAGQPLFDPGIVNVVNAGAAQIASPYVTGSPSSTP